MFNCGAWREIHYKQLSLAGVGSACGVWVTLGLLPLTACVLSRSIPLRLCRGTFWGGPWVVSTSQIYAAQVQVLGYSTKAQTQLGLHFVPFPGLSSSGAQVLGKHSHPQVGSASYHLPHPSRSVFWVYNWRAFSGVPRVSFRELISGCDPPGGRQPSRTPGRLG